MFENMQNMLINSKFKISTPMINTETLPIYFEHFDENGTSLNLKIHSKMIRI